MIQLYFLSVLCTGLAGFLLFMDDNNIEKTAGSDLSAGLFQNKSFHLVLGILNAVVGILVLLSPYGGIPILGDLLPSIAGIIAAFVLIFGIYRRDSSPVKEDKLTLFGESLLRFRKVLGVALFSVALLHFLFPQALFL